MLPVQSTCERELTENPPMDCLAAGLDLGRTEGIVLPEISPGSRYSTEPHINKDESAGPRYSTKGSKKKKGWDEVM